MTQPTTGLIHEGVLGKFLQLALISMVSMLTCQAQKLATLEVNLTANSLGLDIPVHANLDEITFLPDSALSLVEVQGRQKIPVNFQIEHGQNRRITWLVGDKLKKQVYELSKTSSAQKSKDPSIHAVDEDGALTIRAGQRNLLQYHHDVVYPPKGIDTVFKRSAFIHPLWSPHGQVLTRIQAPDHYHHYGIWNPWTHVLYEGDTIDFWNLNGKQGTVRFANFTSIVSGTVFAEYAALHEHVALRPREKVALNEVQTVRLYVPENNPDYYIADITVQLNCPTSPVLLLEYRYGGLGWRTTEQWTKDNSTVLSSEGKTRKDADGSKARWCIVQGTVDNEQAGAVMMSFPANYNHPEPLRIWPENQYNRGDMFANFATTKDTDWLLTPGKNYVLRYRFIVFNGNFSKEKAERAWQHFANPPHVTVIKNQ
jgi:hypothetical protein